MSAGPINLGRQSPAREDVALVKRWVREVWELTEQDAVVVTELQCGEPGCPPLETVVLIVRGRGPTVQHKLHLAVGEVRREHLQSLRLKETGL